MINGLISLANHLDKNGYKKEASFLDRVISLGSKDPSLLSNPNDVTFNEPKSSNIKSSRFALNNILNGQFHFLGFHKGEQYTCQDPHKDDDHL